ncbi:MAG: hypothetical protein WBW80_08875, partial [Acidimicrobiales bacterium]
MAVRDETAASPVDHEQSPAPGQSTQASTGTSGTAGGTVAQLLTPLIRALLSDPLPVRFEFWDGSAIGPDDGVGTLYIRTVDAVRRVMWAPGDLGLGRAYVSGEIDLRGDLFA